MRLKHRPVQDVAAGGGWQSAEVVRYIYQQAEAALTREVMMDADPRNESTNVRTNVRTGPPKRRSGRG
jgi:hypothetical protein